MNLLFLTPQLPFPPQQGTSLRNFNIVKYLAGHHDITLASFGTPEELDQAKPLVDLCQKVEIAPAPSRTLAQRAVSTAFSSLPDMALRLKSSAMHNIAARLMEESFDIVQIEGIEMARYWPSAIRRAAKGNEQHTVFDDHNAEYMLQRTAHESDARNWNRWHAAVYSWIQWKKLAQFERRICQKANAVTACSETDAHAIASLLSPRSTEAGGAPDAACLTESKIRVVPNGVDTDYFVPSDYVCAKPLADVAMVFVGKMDYRPNIDGMTWFCEEILPRIQVEIPRAHVVIVGQKPSARVLELRERGGVQVTDWVPDTRPYVSDAALYVVPLRMGSGTRLKVLEAMAMGKAIVSTSRGVEGIDITRGRDVVVADSPEEFADAAVKLLRDPERCRQIGRSARALAELKYDWRSIVPIFDDVYAGLVSRQA